VTESSLLEAIGLLRDTLGDDRKNPTYIQTVHRRGYRFIGSIELSAFARQGSGELRRDLAEAAFGREGGPAPFFSGPQWRPIVAACVTYVIATICVAVVFAVLGRSRPESIAADLTIDGPRFAIAHSGEVVYVPVMGVPVAPSWTPSGLEIAFAFSKAGPFNLDSDGIDGTPLLAGRARMFPTSWSPDNTRMAFTDHQPLTGADIWIVDLRTRIRRPLARTWFDETWARFSPDGRSIAYMSNETGRWEVYMQPVDGNGARVRVSSHGGAWPSWSSDGKTVLYSTGDTMRGSGEMRAMLEWFAELAAHAGHS